MPGIYLRQGEDDYVAMTETAYDAEKVVQRLIATHPEMLAGDDAGYGALVLVRREAGIGEREDGPRGWSLDHLYLDAKGVPTLVEIKRRGDTRGRREVVAQDARLRGQCANVVQLRKSLLAKIPANAHRAST